MQNLYRSMANLSLEPSKDGENPPVYLFMLQDAQKTWDRLSSTANHMIQDLKESSWAKNTNETWEKTKAFLADDKPLTEKANRILTSSTETVAHQMEKVGRFVEETPWIQSSKAQAQQVWDSAKDMTGQGKEKVGNLWNQGKIWMGRWFTTDTKAEDGEEGLGSAQRKLPTLDNQDL